MSLKTLTCLFDSVTVTSWDLNPEVVRIVTLMFYSENLKDD